jgi:hypothetical protein
MADVAECWIDDPSVETLIEREIVNLDVMVTSWMDRLNGTSFEDKANLISLGSRDVTGLQSLLPRLRSQVGDIGIEPEYREVKKLRWVYPKGRLITCTRDVVLRDIPNPFAKAFNWVARWPFVLMPGRSIPKSGVQGSPRICRISVGHQQGLSLLLELDQGHECDGCGGQARWTT